MKPFPHILFSRAPLRNLMHDLLKPIAASLPIRDQVNRVAKSYSVRGPNPGQ